MFDYVYKNKIRLKIMVKLWQNENYFVNLHSKNRKVFKTNFPKGIVVESWKIPKI